MKTKKFINNELDINQLMIDLGYLNSIQIYKKYGVGIQTQEKLKNKVIRLFADYLNDNKDL